VLGVRPFLDLEKSFPSSIGKQMDDGTISISTGKEGCQSVSGTTSAILLSAVCAAHGTVNEQEANSILTLLPDLLQFVMEEEMDELLRSLLLDAVFCLAKASIEAHRTQREASNGSAGTVSFSDSLTTGLQVRGSCCSLTDDAPRTSLTLVPCLLSSDHPYVHRRDCRPSPSFDDHESSCKKGSRAM
jgi:hypothetical protein